MPRFKDIPFKSFTLELFEVLERHTILSSRHHRLFFPKVDRFVFLHHLQELTDNGYLIRPPALNPAHVFNDFKVHVLGPRAKEQLGYRAATPVSGDFRHKLMTGTITATIELAVIERGFKYVSQEEILAGKFCQQETIALEADIPKWHRPVVPDQVFGIEYAEDNARFFALEADRGTEPITRQDFKQNSIEKKVLQYQSVMLSGSFKKLGVPNIFPMFVTTHDDEHERVKKHRADYILDEIAKLGRLQHFFLVKGIKGFRPYLRTPALVPEIATTAFLRTGQEPFDILNPERQ